MMTKKIPMLTLKPQTFRGLAVDKDERIETTKKVAAVLTKLGRAREIPDLDLSEPFNLPDKVEVGMDLASKDDHVEIAVVPAKRAYKKRAFKRRGPTGRK